MGEQQTDLFEAFSQRDMVQPTDPNVTAPEKPRLKGQSARILERLRQGRASNRELSEIALKYTSRISDIRAAGFTIELVDRDTESGLTWYELKGESC